MIEITYRHHGQRPNRTETIRADANAASTLPSSFEVVGIRYSDPELTLLVEPPNEKIPQEAVNAIANAFESNWGGTIAHVETVVQ